MSDEFVRWIIDGAHLREKERMALSICGGSSGQQSQNECLLDSEWSPCTCQYNSGQLLIYFRCGCCNNTEYRAFLVWVSRNWLTIQILRLILPKAQRRKDFLKAIKTLSCWYSLDSSHWAEYSQMSTHMPGFQSFFSFFASFCIGQISHHQHKGYPIHALSTSWQVSSGILECFEGYFRKRHTYRRHLSRRSQPWISYNSSTLVFNRAVIDTARIDESTKKTLSIIDIEEGTTYRFICKLGK